DGGAGGGRGPERPRDEPSRSIVSLYERRRAEALHARGDEDGARAALASAARVGRDLFEARQAIGDVLAKIGRDEDAGREYEEAIRLEPFQADAWQSLARIRFLGRRWTDAASCAERAVALGPSEPWEAHYILASALANGGDLVRGIREMEIAARLNPGDPDVARDLGNLRRAWQARTPH